MQNIVYLFVIAALISVVFYLLRQQKKERQDLYNRIQSGGLKNYKILTDESPPPKSINPIRRKNELYMSRLRQMAGEERQE